MPYNIILSSVQCYPWSSCCCRSISSTGRICGSSNRGKYSRCYIHHSEGSYRLWLLGRNYCLCGSFGCSNCGLSYNIWLWVCKNCCSGIWYEQDLLSATCGFCSKLFYNGLQWMDSGMNLILVFSCFCLIWKSKWFD
jgi:hypothetical protein